MTPYQALYGNTPTTFPTIIPTEITVQSVANQPKQRKELKLQLEGNLAAAQKRMNKFADTKRKEREYRVGQWVLVKLHQFRQQSLAKRFNFKLSKRYYGPYQILEK